MTYDLRGKVVLITGAAGGIGVATARSLYDSGATLVLAAATREVVCRTVEKFGRLDVAFGGNATATRLVELAYPKFLRHRSSRRSSPRPSSGGSALAGRASSFLRGGRRSR